MKPIDLSRLIKGLFVVIGISIAFGKYDELRRWARDKAFGREHLRPKFKDLSNFNRDTSGNRFCLRKLRIPQRSLQTIRRAKSQWVQ